MIRMGVSGCFFWYQPTWVVPDQRPLNGCVCVCVCVMISGERQKVKQKAVRWPRVVCSKGVGSHSLQSTSCQKWVHKKCSGIK